jgi:hypothetical protein
VLLGNERRLRLKAEEDAAQLNLTFDLQWEADQRAIKAWQAAHPERPNVWPDRCDMVVWLMEHYAQSEARALKAEAALRVWCIPALEAAQENAETYEVHRKWVKEVDDALRYARTTLEGK